MNNLSNRAYAWLAGTLIMAIVVISLIMQHMKEINNALGYAQWGLYTLIILGMLYGLYRIWHVEHLRKLDRQARRREIERAEENHSTEKWIKEQSLLHTQEIERERLRLEQMREANNHTRLMLDLQWRQQHILAQPGHTLFVASNDGFTPMTAPQLTARAGQSEENTTKAAKMLALPAPQALPGPYDLVDIFKRHEIAPDRVFLGLADGGEPLWVDSVKGLCHGAFNAVTGRGKTIVERGLEAQLVYLDYDVLHMDIKFSLVDENGLDYRPIAQRMMSKPPIEVYDENGQFIKRLPRLVTKLEDIVLMMRWLALTEIPRRLEMYQNGDHSYGVLYAFVEELVYTVSQFPEVSDYIQTIIVVGRSVGVKVFTAAQNFQAQSINIPGGMRDNFQTVYYIGGDNVSGSKMLEIPQRDLNAYLMQNNINLGQGVALLRNNQVAPTARPTRIGMASNDAIYYLLGRADAFRFGLGSGEKSFYNTTTQRIPMSDLPRRQTGPIDTDDETTTIEGDGFILSLPPKESEPVRYTPEQEAIVCAAAARLSQKQQNYTRTDIMLEIGWTRKQWPIIKAVCDKYHFAVPSKQEQDHQDYAEIE